MSTSRRNYEVSIWSLQDEFITVLKATNIDYKNILTTPKVKILTDGTQEISFSIPMYLYENGERKENPIWYNTRNGNLIINMRKIKVIFNKKTWAERVFEFIITKVTERHENDQLYCDVEGEGLAFHELGKIGYKISLSSQDFYDEDYKWFQEGANPETKPVANLQYWLDKFLTPAPLGAKLLNSKTWYYSLNMDWSSYEDSQLRSNKKIYEESYTASWDGNLIPTRIEKYKEKERLVDIEESNIYNVTQKLAEIFGVFCKYEYQYDENYHIISRHVIFYNNFSQEKNGYIGLTYPYTAEKISREIDSSDIVTKMFVRSATNDYSDSGWATIMNVEANPSLEDYVLNFDYLYNIKAITDEQYKAIKDYEKTMRYYNQTIIPVEQKIESLQDRLPDVEAEVTLATNAIQLDKERLNTANALLNNLDIQDGEEDGAITIGPDNPKTAVLLQDSTSATGSANAYYIKISEHGVLPETVKIYKTINFSRAEAQERLTNEIKTGTPVYDEFGNLIKITNLYATADESKVVYLTYQYTPKLYYDKVKKTWEARLAKDQADLSRAQTEKEELQADLATVQDQHQQLLQQQKAARQSFEHLMGAALREGYWQPEDFNDYGDSYVDGFKMPLTSIETRQGGSGLTSTHWDDKLFDTELKDYYEVSAAQTRYKYPCIDLTYHLPQLKDKIDKLSFLFYDYLETSTNEHEARNLRSFSLGSQCQLGFCTVENSTTIHPVLLLTGVTSMSDDEIDFLKDISKSEAFLGHLTTTINETTHSIDMQADSYVTLQTSDWIIPEKLVYPRIEISSLFLKTGSDLLVVNYNEKELTNYEDYYVLNRDGSYYITIKPEIFASNGTLLGDLLVKFSLSNADISIYLDAQQIAKENAYPKVSYEVSPSVLNKDFVYDDYNQLARIANINDNDLKLENVQGYISEIDLDLNEEWQDSLVIKNYKSKFEDLFSTIVAQTESMKKSEYTIGLAASIFMANGQLSGDVVQESLRKVNLNYAFNNGALTIDEKNGIWGISDSGVVAMRGGGIFTATEQDAQGNWVWNTGIVPQGINADLITTGQLDTNRIKVYAGDRVRFQLNGDGLFAYKSFLQDLSQYADTLSQSARNTIESNYLRVDDLDPAQFVVLEPEGLFLRAKKGALVLNQNKTDYNTLTRDVDRVAITWDGLTLRNYEGTRTFFANADTGDLYLAGTIFADEFNVLDSRRNIGDVTKVKTLTNFLADEFEDHVQTSDNLKQIFNNAGEIINASIVSLNALNNITIEDTNILNNFYNDIKAGLSDDREIKLYGSSSVDIYTGTTASNLSMLSLSADKGVWIGSGKGINLFANDITSNTTTNSAAVSLNSDKILFGVNSSGSGTVVEMTKNYAIFAAANQLTNLENANAADWTASGSTLAGIKITPDGLWMAATTNTDRSLISLTPNEVYIGNALNSGATGAFISMSKNELRLGAATNFYVNSSNFAVDTTKGGTETGTETITYGFRLGTADHPSLYYANNQLYVKGAIHATSLFIGTNDTDIDDYIPSGGGGSTNYYQAIMPTSGYKQGNTWYNTTNKITMVAQRDYTDNATPANDWIPFPSLGTSFTVDSATGAIRATASSALELSSGGTLTLKTVEGSTTPGHIEIESPSIIFKAGSGGLEIWGQKEAPSTTPSEESSDETSNENDSNQESSSTSMTDYRALSITSDGIVMNGGNITLTSDASLILQSSSTVQIMAKDQSGSYIQFGTSNTWESSEFGKPLIINQAGISANRGEFYEKLTVNGKDVLTSAILDNDIVISSTQPSSTDKDILWFQPIYSSGAPTQETYTFSFYNNEGHSSGTNVKNSKAAIQVHNSSVESVTDATYAYSASINITVGPGTTGTVEDYMMFLLYLNTSDSSYVAVTDSIWVHYNQAYTLSFSWSSNMNIFAGTDRTLYLMGISAQTDSSFVQVYVGPTVGTINMTIIPPDSSSTPDYYDCYVRYIPKTVT